MAEKHSPNALGITVIAMVAGFVAGLLMAPKSGAETRKDLCKKAERYEKKAKDGLEAAKETADEGKRELKALTDEIKIDAKELGSDAKVRARRTITHAKTGAQNVESKARQAWGDRKYRTLPKE